MKQIEEIEHHYCDICGKEIEKYHPAFNRFEYVNSEYNNNVSKDICRECREEIIKFANKLKERFGDD